MNLALIRKHISDGDISKQVLHYLLSCNGEAEYLDFKRELNLNSDRDKAEFSKDAVAMKNVGGGYIVVGVEDKTWRLLGLESQPLYDTKLLKDAIQLCFGVDIDIDVVHHLAQTDKNTSGWFSLILVRGSRKASKRRAPTVSTKDFGHKTNHEIRRGDIYFRKGDSTTRVQSEAELERLIEELDEKSDVAAPEHNRSSYAIEHGLYRLPVRGYDAFVGRDAQKSQLIRAIEQDPRIWIVNLHGPGGVGKTALATWLIYEYYKNRSNVFESAIFLSAKDRELLPTGIGQVSPSLYSLENLLTSILTLFSHDEYCERDLNIQKETVTEILCAYRTLIVLDNMETVRDGRIAEFIQQLPPANVSKILMTSRIRSAAWELPIQVSELSLEEVREFINTKSTEMALDSVVRSDKYVRKIREISGGLPLAIQWTLGRFSAIGDQALERDNALSKDSPLLEFSFRSSWDRLDSDAQQALAILSIFDEPPTRHLWRTTLDWTVDRIDTAIDALQGMTFVFPETSATQSETTYHALPITLSFAQNMLAMMGTLEADCRQRYMSHKEQLDLVAARVDQYGPIFTAFAVTSTQEKRAIVLCKIAEGQQTLGASEAESYFRKAYDTEPRSVYVNVQYGRFLIAIGRIGEGLKHLKTACDRSNKSNGFFAHYNLALAYDQQRDRQNCEKALRKALQFEPKHTHARHMLGVALSRIGNFQEALNVFDELIAEELDRKGSPTDTLIYSIKTKIITLAKTNDLARAGTELRRGYELIENHTHLNYLKYELDDVRDRHGLH